MVLTPPLNIFSGIEAGDTEMKKMHPAPQQLTLYNSTVDRQDIRTMIVLQRDTQGHTLEANTKCCGAVIVFKSFRIVRGTKRVGGGEFEAEGRVGAKV